MTPDHPSVKDADNHKPESSEEMIRDEEKSNPDHLAIILKLMEGRHATDPEDAGQRCQGQR